MKYKGLIAGLGNPGPEYELTRHNAGFMFADHVVKTAADRKGARLQRLGSGGDCEVWELYPAGQRFGAFLLVKPLTYMNLSGNVVARLCGRHEIGVEDVLVVHDELDLAPGRAKLKRGGGANGHNGIISIEERLGGNNFARIRVGVGRPEHASMMVGYVLEKFSDTDIVRVEQVVAAAWKAVPMMLRGGWTSAVQFLNGYRAEIQGESGKEDQERGDSKPSGKANED